MTARRLELEMLPNWPRFLTLSEASAYVGVSPSVFLAEVKAKTWPDPMRRGAKASLATWDKVAIDASADMRSGIMTAGPVAAPPAVDEAEAINRRMEERLRAKVAQRGPQKGRFKT